MRKIKLLTLFAALVFATSMWGTAYNAGTIDLRDLKVGDILMPGVTVSRSGADDWLYMNEYRYKMNGVSIMGFVQTVVGDCYPNTIGTNGRIESSGNTYDPVLSDGSTLGNAWEVTYSGDDEDGYGCNCVPYNVTLGGVTYNGPGVAAGSGGSATPQVLWCSGNSTLYFINAEPVSAGDTYAGQTVTQVMASGDDALGNNSYQKWESLQSSVQTVVFDASFAAARPIDCGTWFASFSNLSAIEGLNNFNTTEVTDLSGMFQDCSSLTSIDLSYFNTPDLILIYEMFEGCSSLVTVDISGVNTANVEYMQEMFNGCSSLTTIYVDRDNWNTGNVTYVDYMFYECYSLVGGSGTTFDDNFDDDENFEYARIDNPAGGEPGYLTEKAAPTPTDFAITANEDPQHAGVYYSTFYHSGADYTLPAGVEAYKAAISGDALNLTKVAASGQSIPAGNAVILKSNAQNYTLAASAATSSNYDGNSLQGTDVAMATPANCYVLSGTDGYVGFYKYTADNLNPHKAYVTTSSLHMSVHRFRFVFNSTNTATDFENVTNGPQNAKLLRDGQLIIIHNGIEYNVAGQQVR